MDINVTRDELTQYLVNSIKITDEEYGSSDLKEILGNKLKLCKLNYANSRFDYNNYILLKKFFKIKMNKNEIILDKIIKIKIKEQDYFQINFVKRLYTCEDKYFKNNWFLTNKYVNTNYISIETQIKTVRGNSYRADVTINLADNYYLVLEYFEKKHLDINDVDLHSEYNRFLQMMYNNKNESKKYVKFIVFWHNHLDDDEYINKIIKMINGFIHDYKNISDQREWCINIIDTEVIHSRELAEQLYDGYLDNNKPIITFSAINKLVGWKNNNCREMCFAEFKVYIDELEKFKNNNINNIDNNDDICFFEDTEHVVQKDIYYEEDKLTYNGLFEFISCINKDYLIDIADKSKLNQLMKNITNGFISGITDRYKKLSDLSNNNIIGLYDDI
jgi:hypothetical protein